MEPETRALLERVAAVINQRLTPFVNQIEELSKELAVVKGEVEGLRDSTVKAVSEAVLKVRIDELAKYLENRIAGLSTSVRNLEYSLRDVQKSLAEVKTLLQQRTGPVEVTGVPSAEEIASAVYSYVDKRLSELERTLLASAPPAASSKAVEQYASQIASAAAAIGSLTEKLAKLEGAVSSLSKAVEEIGEKVDYLYGLARERSSNAEEELEEEQPSSRRR